ncbi:MAG: AAA family ATPase [Bacteroidales bacterium]|nr:AAA family ATPase [Bacteroidales bacterium]
MELLYVWIEHFNNIYHKGFNFSNEFAFDYDEHEGLLQIESLEKKCSFFDKSYLNITAIIGKNGSGKTSLCDFIKTQFTSESDNHYKSVIVIKDKKSKQLFIFDKISQSSEKKITDLEKTTCGYKIELKNNINVIQNSCSLITFSNSLSIYERENNMVQYYDLTLYTTLKEQAKILHEDLFTAYDKLVASKDTYSERDFKAMRSSLTKGNSPIDYLYRHDLVTTFNYLVSDECEQWDFIPHYIDLGINSKFFFKNTKVLKDQGVDDQSILNIRFLLFEKQRVFANPDKDIEAFKDKLVLYLFVYFIVYIKDQKGEVLSKTQNLVHEINDNSNVETIVRVIKNGLAKLNFESVQPLQITRKLEEIKEIILNIDNQFNSYVNIETRYNGGYSLPITKEVKETIKSLFDIWWDQDFMFYLSWIGLSAGESAMLTMFSRLFALKENHLNDNVWVMLDEADLYMHPEWQRKLFKDIHDILPKFFKNKNIQLFLTTHNPFMLSDLPKENVIFLEKEKWLCKVLDPSEKQQTFGSNIHTLYTDSFILNGLMGCFAEEKIKDVIEIIKAKDSDKAEYALNMINMIGESLVKDRLLKMHENAFITNDELKRQIKEIEAELLRRENAKN